MTVAIPLQCCGILYLACEPLKPNYPCYPILLTIKTFASTLAQLLVVSHINYFFDISLIEFAGDNSCHLFLRRDKKNSTDSVNGNE